MFVGCVILGKDPKLSPVPKNEIIVACGMSLGMFRAKARPGNNCFSRPDLGFKNIKSMNCVHKCVRVSRKHIPERIKTS